MIPKSRAPVLGSGAVRFDMLKDRVYVAMVIAAGKFPVLAFKDR